MSDEFKRFPDTTQTLMDLGMGLLEYGPARNEPKLVSDMFTERLGFAAKYLGKCIGAKRSEAYENLARAGGFGNWHHLSEHLKVPARKGGDLSGDWLASLVPLTPLLLRVDREVPLPDPTKAHLETMWWNVSVASRADHRKILDEVGAAMLGEKSWDAFAERSPLHATEPLYRFRSNAAGSEGEFIMSRACWALVDEIDDVFQGYDELPARERRHAAEVVERIAAARPDFLEGQLALAHVLEDVDADRSDELLEAAIAKADSIMPDGFDGRVIWSTLGNRFYHRLLSMRFERLKDVNRTTEAVELAERMLRLNPNDNLGLRFEVMLHLGLLKLDVDPSQRPGSPVNGGRTSPCRRSAGHIG